MSTHGTDGTDLHKSNGEPAAPMGVLDLLVVAAEIWPVLVLGPLLAGAIAYFVAAALPPAYVAFSTFSTNAVVTEPVLRSMLNSDVGENPSRNVAIDEASKATITVTAATPEEARGAVSDSLKALMLRPGLSRESAAVLSENLKQNQIRTNIFQALFDQVQPEIATAIGSEIGGQQNGKNDALTAFITLSDKLTALNSANADLQRTLDSKLIASPDQEIFVSKVQSSKLAPAVLSVLLVGLGVYLLALSRHLWRQASTDRRAKSRIEQIRRSLRLSRSR